MALGAVQRHFPGFISPGLDQDNRKLQSNRQDNSKGNTVVVVDLAKVEAFKLKSIDSLLKKAPGTFEERVKSHVALAKGLSQEKVIEIYKEYPALGARVVAELFKSDTVQKKFEVKTDSSYAKYDNQHKQVLKRDEVKRLQVEADLTFLKQESVAVAQTTAQKIPSSKYVTLEPTVFSRLQSVTSQEISLCNKCAFQAVVPRVTSSTISEFMADVKARPAQYPLMDKEADFKDIYDNKFLEDRVLFSFAKFQGYGKVHVSDTTGVANAASGRDSYAYDLSQAGRTLQVRYTPGHWSHVDVK